MTASSDARVERPTRLGEEPTPPSTTGFGIVIGQVMAGVGFTLLVVFWVIEVVWGSFLGADPTIGLSLSGSVLVLGVAIFVVLTLAREAHGMIGPASRRLYDR